MVPLLLEVSNNIFNLKNIENKSIIIKNYDGETKEFSELLDIMSFLHWGLLLHKMYEK